MSGIIVGLVLRMPITEAFNTEAKFIATVYADHAWEDGTHAYPAVETVADIVGLHERTVQRYLRVLESIGMLIRNGKGPRGQNKYDFPLEAGMDGSVRLVLNRGGTVPPLEAEGGDRESGGADSGGAGVTQFNQPSLDQEEEVPPKFEISQELQAELKELGIFVSIWKDVEKRIAEGWIEADIKALITWMRKTCKDKKTAAQRFVTRLREGTKAPNEFYPRMPAAAQDTDQMIEEDLQVDIQSDETVTGTIKNVWQDVIDQLRMEMPRAAFDEYVSPTVPVHFEPDEPSRLQVGTISADGRDWLENRLKSTVERLLIGIMNGHVEIEFVVSSVVETEA